MLMCIITLCMYHMYEYVDVHQYVWTCTRNSYVSQCIHIMCMSLWMQCVYQMYENYMYTPSMCIITLCTHHMYIRKSICMKMYMYCTWITMYIYHTYKYKHVMCVLHVWICTCRHRWCASSHYVRINSMSMYIFNT